PARQLARPRDAGRSAYAGGMRIRNRYGLVAVLVLAFGTAASAQPPDAESIGSSRNARVAYAMPGEKTPLVFLAGALSDKQIEELKAAAPNVRVLVAAS